MSFKITGFYSLTQYTVPTSLSLPQIGYFLGGFVLKAAKSVHHLSSQTHIYFFKLDLPEEFAKQADKLDKSWQILPSVILKMPNFAKIHARPYFALVFLSSWAAKVLSFTSQGRWAGRGPTDGLLMRDPLFHLVSSWIQFGLFPRIVLGRGGLFVASYYSVSVLCRRTKNKPADAQSIFYASLPNKSCKFLLYSWNMARARIRAHLMGAAGKRRGQNAIWSQEIGLE